MKTLVPVLLASIMMAGCPDTKTPKLPPNVPAPKAAEATQPLLQAQAVFARVFALS